MLFFGLATYQLYGQQAMNWDILGQVEVSYEQDTIHNTWQMLPAYSEALLELDQKTITIRGYLIPTDITGGTFALSAFPFSSCFFCGGAGPESVMELHLSRKESFSTDHFDTFTGIFRIQHHPDGFLYVLENAKRSP